MGITYKMVPELPLASILKNLPIPKFVELVETNPDVTLTFVPHPSTLRSFDPSTSSGHRKLKNHQEKVLPTASNYPHNGKLTHPVAGSMFFRSFFA